MYREKNLLTKKKYIVIVIYTVGKKYVKTNFSVSFDISFLISMFRSNLLKNTYNI